MKLDAIQDAWAEDSAINRAVLGDVALGVPLLHHKYYKILSAERLRFHHMSSELRRLKRNRESWMMGHLTSDELETLGWEQWQYSKPIASKMKEAIESCDDVIDATLFLSLQKEKLDFLDSILHTISRMGFHIKNAIDWEKLQKGIV